LGEAHCFALFYNGIGKEGDGQLFHIWGDLLGVGDEIIIVFENVVISNIEYWFIVRYKR
jgi:hypothetical protein